MQKYLIILPLILFPLFFATSCEEPCAGVVCENGGICIDGLCDCAKGFAGVNCDIVLDPCQTLICENGGTCISNSSGAICQCVSGFEGVRCEKTWTQKYYGNYQVAEVCDGNGAGFDMTVVQGTKFNSITMENFHNSINPSTNLPEKVVADLIFSDVLNLSPQPMTFGVVQGYGNYDLPTGKIFLNFQIINGTDTTECAAILERK